MTKTVRSATLSTEKSGLQFYYSAFLRAKNLQCAESSIKIYKYIFVRGEGDELMIFTVYANELVGPYGFADIASMAEDEPGSLILLTCENESVEGGHLNRRVVFAKPK